MIEIKKYANGRYYNATEKKYIPRETLEALIRSGKKISVIVSKTGEDITAQLIAKVKGAPASGALPLSWDELLQFLRKGEESLSEYKDRYTHKVKDMFDSTKDELDKLVKKLVKEKSAAQSPTQRVKKELADYASSLKTRVNEGVEQRVDKILGKMNLATKEQVKNITDSIEALIAKIEKFEQAQTVAKDKTVKPQERPAADKSQPKSTAPPQS